MGEYMGSFKLGLSKLTMKLLLVTAATAAIALAAPYNPYSGYNLSPIPSYYYAPYNTISGGVPSTAYATYSNLYSPYNTVSYSANSPTASKANKDAMLAFINQAVNDGPEVFTDPVCGAATIAYLDSKIAGKTDKEAGA